MWIFIVKANISFFGIQYEAGHVHPDRFFEL